ncbi:MAG TPA: site-specific integrase [Ruminococcus flavefaciens]|nr:site-specific integrase [Ruminococcus flavefaciens]
MKASLPFKYITAVKGGKHYVVFDYKDNEGKRKRKWIGTDLPEKCAKKALNLKVEEIVTAFYEDYMNGKLFKKAQQKAKEKLTAGDYKFTVFLRDWLETIKPTIAETTYESYSHKLNSVVCYFDTVFPDITLAEVTAVELQKFYNDKFAEGVTANTIKHYHANIHKALKYAVKIGLISCNESEKTDRPKLDKYEATFYNSKELERLFSVFRGDRMEVVVLIAAYYGLRRSEIIGLRWDAIDFDNNTITIHSKAYNVYEGGKLVVKFANKLKTKASHRTLPLIPYIADVLRAKKEQDEYLSTVLKSGYNHEYEDYICTDELGRLITPNYVTDHFANVIKKYKLKKIRFHDLRHSCASLLLANGVPMKAIQEWLGHSTFHVTADFYSHLDFNSKIDSANTIANILGGGAVGRPPAAENKREERPNTADDTTD